MLATAASVLCAAVAAAAESLPAGAYDDELDPLPELDSGSGRGGGAGRRAAFYLPLGEETKLITCSGYQLLATPMLSGATTDAEQVFKKIRVLGPHTKPGDMELVSVEARAGMLNDSGWTPAGVPGRDGVPLSEVAVNVSGARVAATGAHRSSIAQVTVSRAATAGGGAPAVRESVNVTCLPAPAAPGALAAGGADGVFTVVVESAGGGGAGPAHLELRFHDTDVSLCSGHLPELWGVRPMTQRTAKLLSAPPRRAGA